MEIKSRRGLIHLKPLDQSGRLDQTMLKEHRSILDVQPEDTVLKEKTDLLYPFFLEILQGQSNDPFEMVQDIIHACSSVQEEVQKELQRCEDDIMEQRTIAMRWLALELKTWKLLYALYKDRVVVQNEGGGMDFDGPTLGASEKEVMEQLYYCNSTLREYQLIVDWLEAVYENNDAVPPILDHASQSVAWENTLFQLQSQRQPAFGRTVEIVKSLDPDAPVREKRSLHVLDEEDNLRLSRYIFIEVRQGHIDEAMALCKSCGQTWRAAILEGWRLHEDPNYDVDRTMRAKFPMEGNPRRDVWKKIAWMMANSNKHDQYTRAIVGALCGHLGSLTSLQSSSWEDQLWAYLKVQVDIRVESEIRSCCNKSYLPMPEEYWNAKMTLDQIFDELSAHRDAAVRDYNRSKFGVLQRCLIIDNFSGLLDVMREWIGEGNSDHVQAAPLSPHMLRFLTHFILFMRQIGRMANEVVADRIIMRYVECLIVLADPYLVAFYTSTLPSEMQIVLYIKFLETVTVTAARSAAVQAAVSAGLDVDTITRQTVEAIRHRLPSPEKADEDMAAPAGTISDFNRAKISSLEWLTFLPGHRSELLWQTNALIRAFLAEGKTECMRAAFEMVPMITLSHLINFYGSKDNLPARDACGVKEFLCYKVYLVGIDSFDNWSRLRRNPPKEPQPYPEGASFTERAQYEHKQKMYFREHEHWVFTLEEQTKHACDALFNILLFPEMGWLIDLNVDKELSNVTEMEWESRQIQLEKLRCICIPDVVLLLHQVMHVSGDYQGCMRLADEIASEVRQLYKVYTKHKLAELLHKLAKSSLKLIDRKLDPWGYITGF